MRVEDFETPQELEEWMDKQQIDPAEPSTLEYYNNNKDDSFDVNLDSDIRGRAIVFEMTNDRPGWQDEVWAQYKMYKAISFDAEFVYDPKALTITKKLTEFARSDRTKEAKLVFIAFCGHGYTKEYNKHDVYLVTNTGDDADKHDVYQRTDKRDDVDILAECQLVLSKKSCRKNFQIKENKRKIKEKPKVFLVQACRFPNNEENEKKEKEKRNKIITHKTCIIKHPTLKEHMFVFASQPGEFAYRPHFMKSVSKLVINESCEYKLQEILGEKLPSEMEGRCGKRSYFSTDMIKSLNIFPGITRQSDPSSVESGHSRGMRSNPKLENPSGNISPDRSVVTGADEVPHHSNPGNEHGMSASGIDRKTDKDSHSTKQQGEHRDKVNYEVRVNTEVQHTSPSNSPEEKEDAQKIMFEEVSKPENKRKLEENLCDDLETPVRIRKVSEGCVIIHITLEEEEALDTLVFMSDTGLLSSRMQSYLVTQEYLDRCKAEMVKIKATVNSEKMPPLLEELLFECIVENENVSVKCSFKAADDHEVTWFKDGCRLEMTERHTICLENNKPKMKIVKATMKDSGRYKCEYTGLDDRIHIMGCSVVVFQQTDPPKNVHATDIDNVQLGAKQEPFKQDLDVTSCRIENLTPGETYPVSVTSISHEKVETEHSESDPEPLNDFRLDTKPSKPTNVQVNKDKERVEICWQPGPGNNSGFIVRYNEIRKGRIHPVQKIECTNTSLTLDDLEPDTEYTLTVTSLWYGKESDKSETVIVKIDNPR